MDTFAELVPEGTAPPPDIPAPIFEAATGAFLEERRLDMQALAAEVGTSRATLYRRVGDRDKLLGAVLWWLTRHAIARAVDYAERRRGGRRVVSILDRFMHDIHSQSALRHFLDAEPEAALRILTSKRGPVQGGVIDVVKRLLEQEHERGNLELKMDAETLAYIIVRVGESFLYADVIAAGEPDVDRAIEVVSQLLDVTYGPR
jgi:AcrR family transcriptional regulator